MTQFYLHCFWFLRILSIWTKSTESVWLPFAFVVSDRAVLKHVRSLETVWWLCINLFFEKVKNLKISQNSQNCISFEASVLVLCIQVPLLVYGCILEIFISLQYPEWHCLLVLPLHIRVAGFKDPVLQISFLWALTKRGERELNCCLFLTFCEEDCGLLSWR